MPHARPNSPSPADAAPSETAKHQTVPVAPADGAAAAVARRASAAGRPRQHGKTRPGNDAAQVLAAQAPEAPADAGASLDALAGSDRTPAATDADGPATTVSRAPGEGGSSAPAPDDGAPDAPPATATPAAEPDAGTPRSEAQPAIRATKQATLVALLRRPEGASIGELTAATGWQSHSVRGAISFAVKKQLGLPVTSTRDPERGRVYRITASERQARGRGPERPVRGSGKARG